MRGFKGLKDLLVDAVEQTTNLVEDTHGSVTRKVFAVAKAMVPAPTVVNAAQVIERVAAGTVYASIRGTNRLVGAILDLGFEALGDEHLRPDEATVPVRSDVTGSAAWLRDAAIGSLNGAVGDFLAERGNGLAVTMRLRHGEALLPFDLTIPLGEAGTAPVSGKLCLFVHGLGCTEWSWSIDAARTHGDPGVNYGSLLERELSYTPLYLRYNTGRRISDNGRELAALLERLVGVWPVPVEEVVVVGHSMGGLVARSAAHQGAAQGHRWVERLEHLFCLGSPHFGAPLEKLGNALAYGLKRIDLPATQVIGRVIDARSVGIKDLRYGYLTVDDWQGTDPDAFLENHRKDIPFLDHVNHTFIASTVTRDPEHPLGVVFGDLLVRTPSASCGNPPEMRRIRFEGDDRIFGGISHVALANHPAVYAQIKRCLEHGRETRPTPDG
jgi:triacylglycerol lipase